MESWRSKKENEENDRSLPVLHPLTEEVPVWNVSADVISPEKLLRRFQMVRLLGAGAYGWTIEVIDTGDRTKYALKISMSQFEQHSHEVALILNDMHSETPAFVRTYGWYAISSVPLQWQQRFIQAKIETPSMVYRNLKSYSAFACTLMQLGDFAGDSKGTEFTHLELKKIVWIILHGLYVAKKRIGFEHQDLHPRNIVFSVVNPDEPIPVVWHSVRRSISGLVYLPQIIDFDVANFETAGLPGADEQMVFPDRRDTFFLKKTFILRRMINLKGVDVKKWVALVESDAWIATETADMRDAAPLAAILNNPFFSDVLDPYPQCGIQSSISKSAQGALSRCRHCPRLAHFKVGNRDDDLVCSHLCADRWHSLTHDSTGR